MEQHRVDGPHFQIQVSLPLAHLIAERQHIWVDFNFMRIPKQDFFNFPMLFTSTDVV